MRDREGVYFRLTIVSHVSLKTTAKLIKSVWRVNSTWIFFLTNFYNQFSQPIIKFLVVSDIENVRIDLGKCNSTFTFDCDHSVSLHCPLRPAAHDVFILVFGGIRDSFLFSSSSSSTIKIFLTASGKSDGSVRPCLMLSSVTTCFNSSTHEFRGASSSLATKPSKTESIRRY